MKEGGGEIDEEMNTAHVWTNDGQNVVYITPKKKGARHKGVAQLLHRANPILPLKDTTWNWTIQLSEEGEVWSQGTMKNTNT